MRAGRPVSTPVLLFLVGLGIRLIFLWENTANPTFDLPVVDAAVYNDLAVGLVSGHGMTEGFFWQPFFYPMFLAAVYRLVGQSPLVVRVIQAIVGAATCVLVYHLGLRAFSRRTGIVAAIIVAFYGPLIFFEGELLAATWAAFWCTATVLLLLKVRENPSVGNLALLGAAGSLGFLTRPTIAPFFLAGCICVGFALRRSLDLRSRLVRALVLVLACGAFLAPVAVLNHRVTGYFTVMPSSGPYNFYLGNNPESAHTEALRPGEEALRLYRQAADTGFVGGQGAAVCFAQKNRSYVRAKPVHFLKGLVRKTAQFCSSREIPRNVDVYLARDWSILLRLLVWKLGGFGFPFGILLPLAVVGAAVYLRKIPCPLIVLVTLYPLTIIAFLVSGRYRLPIIPATAVLSAAGLLGLADMFETRAWRRAMAWTVCACALAVASAFPTKFEAEKTNYAAELHYNLAGALAGRDRLDEAATHLEQALALEPGHSDARFNYGVVLARQGRTAEAMNQWLEITQREPDYIDAWRALARAETAVGSPDRAAGFWMKVLELDPDDTEARGAVGGEAE